MIARVAAIKDFSNLVKFSFFKKKFIEKFLSKIFPLEDMERSKKSWCNLDKGRVLESSFKPEGDIRSLSSTRTSKDTASIPSTFKASMKESKNSIFPLKPSPSSVAAMKSASLI